MATLPRLLLAFALTLLAPLAHAQWSPTKPVRIIIPFPAGGIVDLMARTVTDRLSASLAVKYSDEATWMRNRAPGVKRCSTMAR